MASINKQKKESYAKVNCTCMCRSLVSWGDFQPLDQSDAFWTAAPLVCFLPAASQTGSLVICLFTISKHLGWGMMALTWQWGISAIALRRAESSARWLRFTACVAWRERVKKHFWFCGCAVCSGTVPPSCQNPFIGLIKNHPIKYNSSRYLSG